MPPAIASKARTAEILIPDFCNLGLLFRALVLINIAVLCGVLLNANGFLKGLSDFVDAAMVVEWASLISLFTMCALRQLLLRAGWVRYFSPFVQRATCTLIPAAVTGYIIQFFASFDWFSTRFSHLTVLKGMLVAGVLGLALQQYFELRMRAFSPVLAEARLQGLQARIRPHFLFNSLNAVLSLIRKEPRRAEEAVEDLAELFRVFMRDARDMVTLEEEIRMCRQYLSLEGIRLGGRLQVEWDTSGIGEETLKKAWVPALLLQPLLENAVVHGVEPTTERTPVYVRIGRVLDKIEISVANPVFEHARNGTLAGAPEEGDSMALDNIRERLQLLYDIEAQMSAGLSGGVFEVRLRFPYIKVAA